VRGEAGSAVRAPLALNLAAAAARELGSDRRAATNHTERLRAVVGVDSRLSGDMLAAASAAGLASAGVDVVLAGVIPTPGLAHLTVSEGFDLGVMLSASHNPMQDNGIKFFSSSGYKLPDSVEDAIEARLDEPWEPARGLDVGRITADDALLASYEAFLTATAPVDLAGMKVVVDCANGASHRVAPEVFRALGAEVIALAVEPDGTNINAGVGSTHPEAMARAVVEHGADLGVAFDGDADRCLAADASGQIVDGDKILGILALAAARQGALNGNTLVLTVMSNLGLLRAMDGAGIRTVSTAVGDRYVLEEMLRGGYSLGGEQSGHVIIAEHSTTGDGTLTAVTLACQMRLAGQPLAELAAAIPRFPQTLINVPDVDKARAETHPVVTQAVRAAELDLGDSGRVLLRPSGTEPLVRVMVEAATQQDADRVATRLAQVVAQELALSLNA
jgi:phosphoglucosamine mutase